MNRMFIWCAGWAFGFLAGYLIAFDRGVASVPVQVPAVKSVDAQCVQWLFESNMKDVRKRMCGGKR